MTPSLPDPGHRCNTPRPVITLRPKHGYSATKYDASVATLPKIVRRQFGGSYDQKKVRNTSLGNYNCHSSLNLTRMPNGGQGRRKAKQFTETNLHQLAPATKTLQTRFDTSGKRCTGRMGHLWPCVISEDCSIYNLDFTTLECSTDTKPLNKFNVEHFLL